MIKEISFGRVEWKSEKKVLETSGYRSANYWQTHAQISADELRKFATTGKIEAIRVWIDGTTKLYYPKKSVDAAMKLGRRVQS
ncbi:hypothetical protein J31TS4_18660 [Paenibacillus sp. J31TS4]|uniref:hypothetical protein n=1 Tax=Paenibacillus sp. J31TS4 TaxID=2807195 RepID=UPI001B0F3AB7|nr:hypothetical protein [Paenibacillus sp. J31TS4]GIP38586.1 hypothetical protein J31TS4_18660 [Paenibacillus sp. J31TS4]